MRDIELIENAETKMIDQIVDRPRAMVKTWACGQYLRARVREPKHIFEMYRVIRRFARHKHELAALL